MKTRFLTQGVNLDERIRAYILKRLERLTKFVPGHSLFEVEVDADKKKHFRVEVMIDTGHDLYRAEETTESIEGSIDLVVDELEAQREKKRTKLHDLSLRGGRSLKKMLVIDGLARF